MFELSVFADPVELPWIGAGEYQPRTGSFISTGPLIGPYDPQDLNVYTYATDNPTTYSDPTGQVCATSEYHICPTQQLPPAGRTARATITANTGNGNPNCGDTEQSAAACVALGSTAAAGIDGHNCIRQHFHDHEVCWAAALVAIAAGGPWAGNADLNGLQAGAYADEMTDKDGNFNEGSSIRLPNMGYIRGWQQVAT